MSCSPGTSKVQPKNGRFQTRKMDSHGKSLQRVRFFLVFFFIFELFFSFFLLLYSSSHSQFITFVAYTRSYFYTFNMIFFALTNVVRQKQREAMHLVRLFFLGPLFFLFFIMTIYHCSKSEKNVNALKCVK